MTKQEKEDIASMTRGMRLWARALGILLTLAFMTVVYLALYAVIILIRDESFSDPSSNSAIAAMLIALLIVFMFRFYSDKLVLKITRQYGEPALSRGRLKPAFSFRGRLRQFLPTLVSWKWLLLLWVLANIGDTVSTALGLHLGATEANPVANASSNMYLDKWVSVGVLTVMAVFFQWKTALKFLTVMMFLVVLHNIVIGIEYAIQPDLAEYRPEVSMPAFIVQLLETALVAGILLWHDRIAEWLRKRVKR